MTTGFWQQMPFVRLIIPFIAGIIIQSRIAVDLRTGLIFLFFSAIATWVAFIIIKKYTLLWFPGFVLNLLMLFTGISIQAIQSQHADHTRFIGARKYYYTVQLSEPLLVRRNSYKATGKVCGYSDSLHYNIATDMNIVIYFKKDSAMLRLHYGDVLLIKSQLLEIPLPANPGEFNYREYMAAKHIYLQVYLRPADFIKLGEKVTNPFVSFAYASQEYIRQTLQQYITGNEEMGVGEALLFGFDDDIDPVVYKSYSRTGTLHVLAVSGMHVGLIFMVLSWLLQPLQKLKKVYLLKPVLLLGGVWMYSLLCGLSPSILRATVMLTFLVIGEVIKRRSSAYNSLAASAFILLVSDPSMISNVGFQLSYAAVLGIIAFYQPLYEWLDLPWRLVDSTWKVIAVSLAAQAFTFPLSLYYFHQFPNYFLLANLLIIPLTTLVIYVGILLLVFSKVHLIALYLGIAMKALIACSNYIAHLVETLPFSYIDNIPFPLPVMLLVYALVLFTWIYIYERHLLFLQLTLACCLAVVSVRTYSGYVQRRQQKLLVCSIKDHLAIQFIQGTHALLIADSALLSDGNARGYHLGNYNCAQGIASTADSLFANNNMLVSLPHQKHLLVLTSSFFGSGNSYDWALVHGKKFVNLEKILRTNKIKHLLFNRGVPPKKRGPSKNCCCSSNSLLRFT